MSCRKVRNQPDRFDPEAKEYTEHKYKNDTYDRSYDPKVQMYSGSTSNTEY